MGKGDNQSAEKTMGNCLTLQIIISVVLTAVLLIWNRDFLLAFGASENTIGYAQSYMNIYALGTIFVQLTLGMNAFITAQGFAKMGMKKPYSSALFAISYLTQYSSMVLIWVYRVRHWQRSFHKQFLQYGSFASYTAKKLGLKLKERVSA